MANTALPTRSFSSSAIITACRLLVSDFDDGNIVLQVGAHDFGFELAIVVEGNFEFVGVRNEIVVC